MQKTNDYNIFYKNKQVTRRKVKQIKKDALPRIVTTPRNLRRSPTDLGSNRNSPKFTTAFDFRLDRPEEPRLTQSSSVESLKKFFSTELQSPEEFITRGTTPKQLLNKNTMSSAKRILVRVIKEEDGRKSKEPIVLKKVDRAILSPRTNKVKFVDPSVLYQNTLLTKYKVDYDRVPKVNTVFDNMAYQKNLVVAETTSSGNLLKKYSEYTHF